MVSGWILHDFPLLARTWISVVSQQFLWHSCSSLQQVKFLKCMISPTTTGVSDELMFLILDSEWSNPKNRSRCSYLFETAPIWMLWSVCSVNKEHICPLVCGRTLSCGLDRCEATLALFWVTLATAIAAIEFPLMNYAVIAEPKWCTHPCLAERAHPTAPDCAHGGILHLAIAIQTLKTVRRALLCAKNFVMGNTRKETIFRAIWLRWVVESHADERWNAADKLALSNATLARVQLLARNTVLFSTVTVIR